MDLRSPLKGVMDEVAKLPPGVWEKLLEEAHQKPVTEHSAGHQRRADEKRARRRQVNLRRVATGGCWSTVGYAYSKSPMR